MTVHVRVATLLKEIVTARQSPMHTIPVNPSTLTRLMSGERDYLLSSLVETASALGYDVVINLREQR